MPDEVHSDHGSLRELRDRVDDPGLLIYERVLPAIPASVGRVRSELLESLTWHQLAADRHADIALMVSEAATNAVLHAYLDTGPGPLYVAATLGGDALTVCISDFGRGMRPRRDSPGLGLGVMLMDQLCDDLEFASDPAAAGTCVTATFARMAHAAERRPAESRHRQPPGRGRREILVDYLQALRATNTALRQDTDAVLAEADLAVARSRRRRQQRVQQRARRHSARDAQA